MHLTVGDTVIPYDVRISAKATRKRIVVTPGRVEVVVPAGTPMDGAEGVVPYVHRKRRWVFDAVRELEERRLAHLAQQYASGAKLQYRGRWIMLDVRAGDVATVGITFRNKLHVVVPEGLGEPQRSAAVGEAFTSWLRHRALDDIERHGRHHESQLGIQAGGYRLSNSKARWGSCGKDGVVRVHWTLIQAPAAALQYVVAHEVAHLVERHHGPAFWATLARTMPDWAERKSMLERWEGQRRTV